RAALVRNPRIRGGSGAHDPPRGRSPLHLRLARLRGGAGRHARDPGSIPAARSGAARSEDSARDLGTRPRGRDRRDRHARGNGALPRARAHVAGTPSRSGDVRDRRRRGIRRGSDPRTGARRAARFSAPAGNDSSGGARRTGELRRLDRRRPRRSREGRVRMRCSAPRILVAVLTAIVLGALGRAPAQGQGAGESEHPWVLEGDSLWGSRDQGTEIVNPRIRHEELRSRALHGRLSADRQTLVLIDDVRIEDTTRVVVSEQGVYRRAQRVLDLVGNVVGRGPEGDFRADELTYDRATGRMELRGQPEVSDSGRVVW